MVGDLLPYNECRLVNGSPFPRAIFTKEAQEDSWGLRQILQLMNATVEVLDCGFEELAGNIYNDASLLSLEADLSELKDSEDNTVGMIAKSHTLFGPDCLFVNGTIIREGNLDQVRFKVSDFSVL